LHSLYLLEAWWAARQYRRHGSLVFFVALYWALAGWLLSFGLHGLLRGEPSGLVPLESGQILGGLVNAVVAEAALLWTPLRKLQPAEADAPLDLQRFLLTRASLVATAPGVVLAVVASSRQPLAAAVLALGTVFVSWLAFSWLARRVSVPLKAIDRAVDNAERGLADDTLRTYLGDHPIAEVRSLASRLGKMYSDLAHHDPLTGLPNRRLLIDRLNVAVAQAHRTSENVGLLYVDIDRFRAIDNSLGRRLSNEVLKELGARFSVCVRAGDTVARVGDDEFALLVPRLGGMDEAATTAQRVRDVVKRRVLVAGSEVFATASVGISFFPRDGDDAETLLKNAQAATFVAKEGGQDSQRRYTASISAKDVQRLAIETALRGALARNEMVLHFQPSLGLASGRVEAAEALVRCPGTGGRLMSPGEFIPVAEASDLIVDVGLWVLSSACAQARAWRQRGHRVGVAVNLSARQLQQPDLLSQVLRALEASGLEPGALELEITETAAMQNIERSVEILRALRGNGISIAMDDFGTGYSSLGYLRKLPVDKVKLDKSFLSGVTVGGGDAAIAVAVIALAHSLSLKVVAEGVETREELRFLRDNGCDAVQGYLFSGPVTAAELEKLLEQGRTLEHA
jgi:diguanylate cyclase (GGDEF)-like protein